MKDQTGVSTNAKAMVVADSGILSTSHTMGELNMTALSNFQQEYKRLNKATEVSEEATTNASFTLQGFFFYLLIIGL